MSLIQARNGTLRERTPREESRLYTLLEGISHGRNIIPRKSHNCIIIDIEKDARKVDPTFFDNRIQAFQSFLETAFWMDTDIVGASGECIRVYLRPRTSDLQDFYALRDRIRHDIQISTVHGEMKRCEINRAFFYGITLVVQ